MEVITYVSYTALAAIILDKALDVLMTWYYSEPVQQFVNTAIVIKEHLPPFIVHVGFHGLVLVANVLHVVVHVIAQLALAIPNLLQAIVVVGKALYVVLRSINTGIAFLWNFPQTYLVPFVRWFVEPPVPALDWYWILMIFGVVFVLTYKIKNYYIRWAVKKED